MYKTGVTLILLVAAAGDGVANLPIASGTRTLHLVIFTAVATHNIPLCPGAILIDDRVLRSFGVGGEMEGVQVRQQQAGPQ